jgi:hypothetical protein
MNEITREVGNEYGGDLSQSRSSLLAFRAETLVACFRQVRKSSHVGGSCLRQERKATIVRLQCASLLQLQDSIVGCVPE